MIEKIKNNKLKTIVALISTFVFCIGLASSITSGVGDTYAESSSDYDCPIGGSLYFGTISTGSTGYYCQLGDTVLISASYTNYKVGADISSDSDCRSYLSEMGYVYNTSGFYCTYDAIRHQNSSGDIDVNNSCYYCSTMTAGNNTVFGPKEPSTICLNSSWQNISGITSESDCISYGYSAGDDPSGDTEFFNTHIKYNAAYDGKHSEVSYNATSTNSSGTSFTWGVDSSGNILKNGEVAKTTVYYGNNIATSGLMNYNNKELFYATRKGYHVVDGEEWKCMSGCTTSGKVFDQSVSYVSTDFCSSYSDACTVVIGINWVIDTYTIKYDANGGSGAPSSQTKTHGTALTLSTTKPSKTGYTFLGWDTSSDAKNVEYKAGASYTANSDATLYAVWDPDEYTVKFDANGGSGVPSSQTKTHGTALTLSSTKPTKTGYTFLGWSTDKTATSAKYQAGGSYTAEGNATLFAIWKANTYKIAYTLNDGVGTGLPNSATYDKVVEISKPKKTINIVGNLNKSGASMSEFSPVDLTFAGWTSSTINTKTAYHGDKLWDDGNTKVTDTKFKNLTSTNNDTVTMIANWNDTEVILPSVSKEGYTCVWNTKSDGKGDSYASGGKYTVKADSKLNINLYAICEESSKADEEIDSNVKTGDVLIFFAWIIGIGTLGYSVYYFRSKRIDI